MTHKSIYESLTRKEDRFSNDLLSREDQGKALRWFRVIGCFSQRALATATGLEATTISAIEMGKLRLGLVRARKIARVLHLDVRVFLFERLP
jgi:transcriptional regulator with XRE-family HTH domain